MLRPQMTGLLSLLLKLMNWLRLQDGFLAATKKMEREKKKKRKERIKEVEVAILGGVECFV